MTSHAKPQELDSQPALRSHSDVSEIHRVLPEFRRLAETANNRQGKDLEVRLHSLDGLRSIAIALVFAHHLGGEGVARAAATRGHHVLGFILRTIGTSGVELFFVLSGVVLARPYLRGGREFRPWQYLKRRAVRLFPPYFVAWLVTGAAYYLAPWAGPFRMSDWLSQAGIVSFGVHYAWAWWSLTVEALFYLLLPVLIPVLRALPRNPTIALVLFALSVGAGLVSVIFEQPLRLLPREVAALGVYAPCFTAGLLMGRLDFPRIIAFGVGITGALVLGISLCLPLESGPSHIGYGLVYACIVSRALDPTSRLQKTLNHWQLVWLGERSYSLFLIHCAVMLLVGVFAQHVLHFQGSSFRLVGFFANPVLSMFAAMLLFTFVERKFARGLASADSFWPIKQLDWPCQPAEKANNVAAQQR